MNNTDIDDRSPSSGFGAIKKAVAKLMGIKRLRHGANFTEDASTAEIFVGERQYNMGDLWREPSD